MTIECYQSTCPFHSFQAHSSEGPFCFQSQCQFPVQVRVWSRDEWCYSRYSHYFQELKSQPYHILQLKPGVDPEPIIHSDLPNSPNHFWFKKQPHEHSIL